MERRTTTGHRSGARWCAAARSGLGLVLGAGLLLAAGAATAQERSRSTDCRCVDRDGNEIENCTCFVQPDFGDFARIWSFRSSNRARIGVTVSATQEARSDRDGAYVASVLEGGPADEAGIREGDIIVRLDGRSLFEPLDEEDEDRLDLDESAPVQRLLSLLSDLEPGEEVEIEYLRDGETRRAVVEAEENPRWFGRGLTIVGGDRPEGFFERGIVIPREGRGLGFHFPDVTSFRPDTLRTLQRDSLRSVIVGWMDPCFGGEGRTSRSVWVVGGSCVDGVELTPLNPGLAEYFGTDEGLLVTDVREASTLGLRPGDVLQAVDGRDVEDLEHVRRILRSYEPDEELTLRIVRRGESMEISGRRR